MERLTYVLTQRKIFYNSIVCALKFGHCEVKMSRAHMLYDNKPLDSVPVSPLRWEKRWEPEQIFRLQRFAF